jgi:CheY-like chemotaxis protein/light-regulated signal transduction histidine kinase (bacteriophytochrome)
MKLAIVDDIATNRELLRERFEAAGHTTFEAADGIEALQILAREKVDAVLSDILMPRMDGYRLCHEIRTNDCLRDLPIVIYTSTYNSPSDEKLALSLGADKYLKKPAPFETILIALHEAIAMQHTTPRPEAWQEVEVLKAYSDRLVSKLEERNIELTAANERLTILDRAKADFLDVISHEFRAPLCGFINVGELILGGMCSPEENSQLQELFERSRRRILSILDDALLLTRIDVNKEQFGSAPVSLSSTLSLAIEGATEFAESRHVRFARPSTDLDLVAGDEDLLVRAFHALLETAVKFSEEGETVRLAHEVVADSPTVIIESRGRTIPTTALPKFFEIFSIEETLTPSGDLGLGPPVAYRILSLFGASVSVANLDSSGIRLTISLRKAAPDSGRLSG